MYERRTKKKLKLNKYNKYIRITIPPPPPQSHFQCACTHNMNNEHIII